MTKEQAAQASDAERAAAQQKELADAAERREREAERAAGRKSYPDDADPPAQRVKLGETAYSHERLTSVQDSEAFTGYPHYVVVGALADSKNEYLTVAEAKDRIAAWLDRPVGEAG